jgi:uncharacterized membrane protein
MRRGAYAAFGGRDGNTVLGGYRASAARGTLPTERTLTTLMLPFILLLVVFVGLSVLPPAKLQSSRARMRIALAAMFVFTGATHFAATGSMLQMLPDGLPMRLEAVYLSGLAQFAGAVGLLIPRLRRAAGLGLAAMLIAVFPANINVALNNLQIELLPTDPFMQWARLLVQPVLIVLVIWASAPERRSPAVQVAAARA